MRTKNKLVFVELARVLCIFLVVFLHSIDMVNARGGYTAVTLFVSVALRFVVPAFFMISGLLMAIRHRDPNYSVNTGGFWRGRLQTLILPFLIWNVIYMVVEKDLFHAAIVSSQTAFNLATGYLHLYFVFVLLQCLAVYSIIGRNLTARLVQKSLLWAALASVAFYGVSEYLLWTQGGDGHFFEWHYGKLIFAWGIFFFWGIWLGHHPERLEKVSRYRFVFLATAIIALIPYYWDSQLQLRILGGVSREYFLIAGLPFQFLAANAFLGFLYHWEPFIQGRKMTMTLAGWGKYMFGVYVAHFALLLYLDRWWTRIFPGSGAVLQVAIVAIGAFLITLAFVRICGMPRLSHFNRFLFGGRGSL